MHRPDRVVICTDSLSDLESIQSTITVREDFIIELNHCLLRLQRRGIHVDVQLCWVPAHEGVQGNEHADKLAKDAFLKEIAIAVSLGKGEGKAIIKKKVWKYGRKGGRKIRKGGDATSYRNQS